MKKCNLCKERMAIKIFTDKYTFEFQTQYYNKYYCYCGYKFIMPIVNKPLTQSKPFDKIKLITN